MMAFFTRSSLGRISSKNAAPAAAPARSCASVFNRLGEEGCFRGTPGRGGRACWGTGGACRGRWGRGLSTRMPGKHTQARDARRYTRHTPPPHTRACTHAPWPSRPRPPAPSRGPARPNSPLPARRWAPGCCSRPGSRAPATPSTRWWAPECSTCRPAARRRAGTRASGGSSWEGGERGGRRTGREDSQRVEAQGQPFCADPLRGHRPPLGAARRKTAAAFPAAPRSHAGWVEAVAGGAHGDGRRKRRRDELRHAERRACCRRRERGGVSGRGSRRGWYGAERSRAGARGAARASRAGCEVSWGCARAARRPTPTPRVARAWPALA